MYKLRVKDILKERQISMSKLSRGADIPMTTIVRLCNDTDYNPTFLTLKKVADYLGVTIDALYTDDEVLPNS